MFTTEFVLTNSDHLRFNQSIYSNRPSSLLPYLHLSSPTPGGRSRAPSLRWGHTVRGESFGLWTDAVPAGPGGAKRRVRMCSAGTGRGLTVGTTDVYKVLGIYNVWNCIIQPHSCHDKP